MFYMYMSISPAPSRFCTILINSCKKTLFSLPTRLPYYVFKIILLNLSIFNIMDSFLISSVLINGSLEGEIYPSRGIRQGDPLLPYIFIFCVEFLGKELMKQVENPKNYKGIPTHLSGHKIPFLMFADDCIILLKLLKMHAITLIESYKSFVLYLVNL